MAAKVFCIFAGAEELWRWRVFLRVLYMEAMRHEKEKCPAHVLAKERSNCDDLLPPHTKRTTSFLRGPA